MKTLKLVAGLAILMEGSVADARVRTQALEYLDGDAVLEGFLAWDDARRTPRPGVVVIHDWSAWVPR